MGWGGTLCRPELRPHTVQYIDTEDHRKVYNVTLNDTSTYTDGSYSCLLQFAPIVKYYVALMLLVLSLILAQQTDFVWFWSKR